MPALITWWTQDVTAQSPQAHPALVAATGADLLRRWTEPQRRYHGTQHLVEMFWALEEITDARELSAHQAVLGRVAAWLHDAVYDPGAVVGANETASAALAGDGLSALGFRADDVEAVVALVRMTADHVVPRADPLTRAFHDADLWILSAPAERFDAYCAQVREEYASVPEPLFRSARAAILRDLASGPQVYLTDHGRRLWDAPARANVERELERLR